MAAISSKKLLPSTEKKEKVFLVPYTNIVPSTPKALPGGVEKKKVDADETFSEKIQQLVKVFGEGLVLKNKEKEVKRKEQERKNFQERESKLEEKKLGRKQQQKNLVSKTPGFSVFDKLERFTGFTLLGFIFNNYSKLLPALTSVIKFLKPAAVGFGYFAEGLFSNTIEFIERGYKAYDKIGEWKKQFGENYSSLFDSFSSQLNILLNTAVVAGLVGIRGGALRETGAGSEAITKSKSIFGGEASLINRIEDRNKITERVKQNRSKIIKRKVARIKLAQRQRDIKITVRSRRRAENQLKIEKRKATERRNAEIRKAKQAANEEKLKKLMQTDPSSRRTLGRTLGSDMFEGILPRQKEKKITKPKKPPSKPPETLRMSRVKFAEMRGGDYVDFGLPGRPTKRLPPQVAEGIRGMYENPMNRDDFKKATLAFDNPEIYEYEINKYYRRSRRQKFRQSAMRRPGRAKPIKNTFDARKIGQRGARAVSRGARVVPFIGPLIDVVISVLAGDPLDEAVVGAAGATLGSFIGGAIVGTGTFGLGAVLGAGLGAFVGDVIARSLYDAAKQMFNSKRTKGYNQGGVVASRQIKRETKPKENTIKTVSPVGLQSRFSEKDLKTLYGDSVGILGKISGIMASPGGFIGSIMSSSINLLFGQKFDDKLLSYIRQTFGRGVESNVRSSVDTAVRNLELFLAFGKDSQQTKLAPTLNRTRTFMGGPAPAPGPAPGDALERRQGETPRPAGLDPSIPMDDDIYVFPDGSILKPGMEVGSLQMTPTYAKHMEFTYAIQPVMVG